MIRIHFAEPTTPEWQKWRETCEREQSALNESRAAGLETTIKSSLYGAQKEAVYARRNGPFHGKCAYCESDVYSNQPGDIEHFRPKNRVAGEDGKPIKIQVDGEERDHPGYYWLAYDWRNLLLSCELCNRPSKARSDGRLIGKRDYFPVEDFRAVRPGEEAQERPLLINPVLEDPEEHLTVDKSGVFTFKTEKGETCRNVFGLNERGLPDKRRETYNNVKNLMNHLRNLFLENREHQHDAEINEEMGRLRAVLTGRSEYAAAGRLAVRDKIESDPWFREALFG